MPLTKGNEHISLLVEKEQPSEQLRIPLPFPERVRREKKRSIFWGMCEMDYTMNFASPAEIIKK